MPSNRGSLTVAALLSLLALQAAPTAASVSYCNSIAAARHAELGSAVSLVGVITVPSGAFDDGIAIQQGSAGIYVVDSVGGVYETGDLVRVIGVLASANNLLVVQPSSIERLQQGRHVRAQWRPTGSVGEANEGKLLKLHGKLVGDPVDDSPYGWKLTLDDGSGPIQVFLYPDVGISTEGLVAGTKVSVTCFSSQYDATYECAPRGAADITVLLPR